MLDKNPQNYERVRNEISVYEQKPIKIDDLNEAEEKSIKECIKKKENKKKRDS